MPVDQSGENILFVIKDGYVEAHIQIQYTGDPQSFAWLVPVPAMPEVSVGSQQLFVNLLNATVPTFALNTTFEFCSDDGTRTRSGGCGFAMGGSSDSGNGVAFDGVGADASADGGATPSSIAAIKESVGAFDVTVLQPTQADEVTSWLQTNGFLQSPDAPPILQDYINRGHVFVAVKLHPGAGVDEIHPLVVRYAGSEPCIPLKLTAIAATEDMAVRAFFLGDRRVMPVSYKHVVVNPAEFDWINLGTNYVSAVSRAVDAPGADGHAFITEYAGSSAPVSNAGVYDTRWNSVVFRTASPEQVIDLLQSQGLVNCPSSAQCVANHPLVLPIVEKYLPAPAGMLEAQFYSCLSCYSAQIDQTAWDADAFANELDDRVIQPALHANELLASSTYVTRLFTTISPSEMTDDPTFAGASLSEPPVTPALQATLNRTCEGDQVVEIGNARDIVLESSQMPSFSSEMPAALAVEQYDDVGHRTLISDNRAAIDTQIKSWNDAHDYPPAARPASSPSDSSSGDGCGCIVGRNQGHAGHLIAGAVAVSLLRRLWRSRRKRGSRG